MRAASDPRVIPALRPVSWGAALVLAACGCSGPEFTFAPVEGTVTRNGRPVPHAQVIFMADEDTRGPRATGVTDAAGRFRLATDSGQDGAPVGHHRVCVCDTTVASDRIGPVGKRLAPEAAGKFARPKVPKEPSVPPVYGRPGETPLRAEVRPGAQTIDLQVP